MNRTNAGSKRFSFKSLTNLDQSDSDSSRSKYDLKILMFMKEIVYCDAWTVTFCFRASKDLGQNGYGDINHVGNKA